MVYAGILHCFLTGHHLVLLCLPRLDDLAVPDLTVTPFSGPPFYRCAVSERRITFLTPYSGSTSRLVATTTLGGWVGLMVL